VGAPRRSPARVGAKDQVRSHNQALVAQWIEHLTTDQKVGGSTPSERAEEVQVTAGYRTGMHALAIQVDPIAYRAVKADALQRGSSIPRVIGEILTDSSRQPIASSQATGRRWRRTGEGRKANQHTRIEIADDAWWTVRRDAVRRGLTIARWIGLNLETWAPGADVEDAQIRDGERPHQSSRENGSRVRDTSVTRLAVLSAGYWDGLTGCSASV
jgi:hypothetical protein